MSREIPKTLRKQGITRVADNVPDGYSVRAPAKRFCTLFRKHLFRELTRPAGSSDEPGRGVK